MNRFIIIVAILILSVSSQLNGQGKGRRLSVKADTTVNDSVKYELIIFDAGFDAWLVGKPSVNFRSQKFYEIKNRLYVSEWNYRHSQPLRYGPLYDTRIDYDPFTDYGLEINYRLFYYFQYFEEKNKVNLGVSSRF